MIDFRQVASLFIDNNEVSELWLNGSKVWEKPASIFTVQARTSNVTIGSTRYGSPSARDLEYSIDGGTTWNTFTLGSTTVTLANAGDKMMLRGTNSTIANTWQNYWKLTFSNDVDVYGNLNSLLGGSEDTLSGSFYGLFDGQTHLIDASGLVLPWTTITSSSVGAAAFEAMFRNCSGLTSVPDLPATTVDSWCYNYMFQGCSSLEDAPTIYAVDLAEASLNFAFDGCSSLTGEVSFPNLQTANAPHAMERCFRYAGMEAVSMPNLTSAQGTNAMTGIFEGCPNLTTINVPKLSYTSGSYNMNAFAIGSDNLEVVDWSQATQVPAIQQGATGMFSSADYKIVVPDNLYDSWVVAYNWSQIASHIVRASDFFPHPMTFVARQANSTVTMTAINSAPSVSLEYSTDGATWSDFIVGTTIVTLANVGDKVSFRAGSGGNTRMGTSGSNYNKFVTTGSLDVNGNIMSLLDQTLESTTITGEYAFVKLFFNTSPNPIVDASSLQLPATTLASHCYEQMFYNCPSLTKAPKTLPATTLVENCYQGMFQYCTLLTTAPELPATTLATKCYSDMFRSCTSLTSAPFLPEATLANECYRYMFQSCSSLNSIKIAYTGNFSGAGVPTNAFGSWVSGVASTGDFYYNGSDTTVGVSAIPTGWTKKRIYHGLTFIAESAGATVAMKTMGSAPALSLEYSTDDGGTWSDFTVGSTTITLANIGDECCIRAKTTNAKMANSYQNGNIFNLTGSIGTYGDATFMLDKSGGLDTIGDWALGMLFWDCTGLTHAPDLPSTHLGSDAYDTMFCGCTSLTEAPDLPATDLGNDYCYSQMFAGCTSLTKAPYLPATNLKHTCYLVMFQNCTSLNEIKMAYTGSFSTYYMENWVDNVAASGTFYYNGSDTSNFGTSAIPSGWTVQSF